MKKKVVIPIVVILGLVIIAYIAYNDQETRFFVAKTLGLKKTPSAETGFIVEELVTGLRNPTTMTFVGNDILFLQKNDGKVRLIKEDTLLETPILDFNVSNKFEAGLLGIIAVGSKVFIYVTESDKDGGELIGNYIYSYRWTGKELVDKQLVNVLPAYNDWHVGGVFAAGLDGTVYAVTGDQGKTGILQNHLEGDFYDTSVIIQIGLDPIHQSPLASSNPTEHYQAIGIRNSFGLAVDPVTGFLWDTENGPENWDEINLVFPKFNSGWEKIMGFSKPNQIASLPKFHDFVYSEPEFTWEESVAPTALVFPTSEWNKKFENTLLVGDCRGNLYKFELNSDRTGFVFVKPDLKDLIANYDDAIDEIVIVKNLGCITDIELGPDNSLYVVSHASNGAIYKIKPTN